MEIRYCIDHTGVVYKEVTERRPVNVKFKSKLIADELATIATMGPCVSVLHRYGIPLGDLHFIINGLGVITHGIVRMSVLNFNSRWDIVNDVLIPQLNHNNTGTINPLESEKKLLWKIPNNLPTYWCVNLVGNACSIVSFHEGKRKLMPLPNMWNDSRLCWTPANDRNPDYQKILNDLSIIPALDRIVKLYDMWVDAPWNQDLAKSNFSRFFRWNREGKQITDASMYNELMALKQTSFELDALYKIIATSRGLLVK